MPGSVGAGAVVGAAGSFVVVCLHREVRILAGKPARQVRRRVDGRTHPDPLLQTERLQQSRKFNIELLRLDVSVLRLQLHGGGRRENGDANLGHGVRMDGRRHSHYHCLHCG